MEKKQFTKMEDLSFLKERKKNKTLLSRIEMLKKRSGEEDELLLCFYYCYGLGSVKIDKQEAEKRAISASQNGNKLAAGMRYFYGWNKEKDYERANLCFNQYLEESKSEELRSYSLNMIGFIHYNGLIGKVDFKKAIEFYLKAVELGFIIFFFFKL